VAIEICLFAWNLSESQNCHLSSNILNNFTRLHSIRKTAFANHSKNIYRLDQWKVATSQITVITLTRSYKTHLFKDSIKKVIDPLMSSSHHPWSNVISRHFTLSERDVIINSDSPESELWLINLFIDWLGDWDIHWVIEIFMEQLRHSLGDWDIHWVIEIFIEWLRHSLSDWGIHWVIEIFIEWLRHSLSEWDIYWVIEVFIGWMRCSLSEWQIHCVIEAFTDWLSDSDIHWAIHWVSEWVIETFIQWLRYSLSDWAIAWVVRTFIESLRQWLSDWDIYCLIEWLRHSLSDSDNGWVIETFIDWLSDWLIDWEIDVKSMSDVKYIWDVFQCARCLRWINDHKNFTPLRTVPWRPAPCWIGPDRGES
jgi:hypothetical protein